MRISLALDPKHNRKETIVKRIQMGILVLAFLTACLMPVGVSAGGDRIAFLNIRMVRGEPVLEGIEVVEGRLKIPKRLHLGREKLYCEVKDAAGNRIFETVVPDPSVRRLEYVDGDGTLHSKIVTEDDAFISIRIPYDEAARTLEIYSIDTPPGGVELSKRARKIGTLTIDVRGGGNE